MTPPRSLPVSIIICTFNRSQYLSSALDSICPQVAHHGKAEVLVVDNNSTDETARIVQGFCRQYTFVRYIFESNEGLSHARNRGWQEAYGEYVGYLDDDAKAGPNWLGEALKIIEEHKPDFFGGPFYPFYDSHKPYWYLDRFGSREPHEKDGYIESNPDLNGGNMFIRHELLEKLGGYDPKFGMTGDHIAYGEETVLQRRIYETTFGKHGYYSSKLFIYHLVAERKMTFRWRIRQLLAKGRYAYRLYLANPSAEKPRYGPILRGILSGFRLLYRMTIKASRRDREIYPYYKSYLYDYALTPIRDIGLFYEYLTSRGRKP